MAYLTTELNIESIQNLLYNVSETISFDEFLTQSKSLTELKLVEPYLSYYSKFSLQTTEINISATNRTSEYALVLYTAVPKTGSTLIGLIMLEKPNIFVSGHKVLPMKRIKKGYPLIKDIN